MGNIRHETDQFETIQLSPKSSSTSSKVQLEQQNDRSNSDINTARTQSLVNGYTNHLSLKENGCSEDGDKSQEDNELEDDSNYEARSKSDAHAEGDMAISSCGNNYSDNGGDDDDDNDGNYGTDRDVDCHRDDGTGFECCYDDFDDGDNDDDEGDQKDRDFDDGVENNDDPYEDCATGDDESDLQSGGGVGNYDNSAGEDDDDDDDDSHNSDVVTDGDDDDDDDDDDDGSYNSDVVTDGDDDDDDDDDDDSHNSDVVTDGDDDDDDDDDDDSHNSDVVTDGDDDEDDDDDDDDDSDADDDDNDENDDNYSDYDDNEDAHQASSLPTDNDVSRKTTMSIKSVFKDSSFSLPVNNNRTKVEKVTVTENIVSKRGSKDTDNENLPDVGGRSFFSNNVNTANVPVTSHSTSLNQEAKPKTSPHRLPLSNAAEPDDIYSSSIPSLEVTGIDHNFLARHTTDQSLKYTSQPNDSNLTTKSTSPLNCPVWSLLHPTAPETSDLRQQHSYSRRVHSAFVSNRPTAPNNKQLWNQPRLERNYTNLPREEQQPFNNTNSWFTRQEEAFDRFRISENSPGATGTQVGKSFNRQSWMPSAFESRWSNPAYNFSGSQTSSSSYGDFAARSQPPAEQHSESSNDYPSGMLQRAPLSPGSSQHGSLAPGSIEDPTLASLERKVAEACVVVKRVMRAFESRRRNPAYNFSGSQTSSSSYGDFAARSQAPAEQNSESSNDYPSGVLQRAPLSPGSSQRGSLAPGSIEDPTLASLERKVAEACAVVKRVMREREERTKKQREAAERERERREHREREAREARKRKERETREREAREMSEREIREQRENEERVTKEESAAAERAPVQECAGWQCEHYQRCCTVKFPCCGIFYPCHRCHNVSGACDTNDRRANHATHVKCGSCGHEEEINELSQYCSSCGIKISEYFCFKCKHFVGVDKNPYHCNKCRICRIERDKSFHCDVCNVCLDKRLKGKHKCRPDSGHDECLICLKDVFSGCVILPCSHKVHRKCAIPIIQNNKRNCPKCYHPLYRQDSL